jgi:outer membrane lipoprotein-sorting protein
MKMRKNIFFLLLSLFLFSLPIFKAQGANDLLSILKHVDSIMVEDNAKYKLRMAVTRGDKTVEYEMTLWSKGRNFVARTEKPIAQKGQVFLINNNNCWTYYPNINKSVKTSQNQRLLGGDFSFTDLASVNLIEDYDSEFYKLRKEDIWEMPFVDGEFEELIEKGVTLQCLAKEGRTVTYPKVMVFIDESGNPVRLDFFTISGQLLGVLFYQDYGNLGGKEKPLTMVMRASLNSANYTTITHLEANYDLNVPQIYFTEAYMKNLSIGR